MKVLALIAAPLIVAPSPAKEPTSPWPAAVRAAVSEATTLCRGVGGKPGRSPDVVKTADLNADGLLDYIVDWGFYECIGAQSAMTNGQSGSTVEILVGQRNRIATKTYSDSVYGAKIETVGGRSKL